LSVLFSSVSYFAEQVGRRLQWRYAELDNLLCTYVGPSSQAIQFKPPINSPHPQYPLMFVTDSNITNREAGVAEVAVTYAGIIQTSGASSYITPPVTTESSVQGSRDFTQYVINQITQAIYGTGTGTGSYSAPTYNYGTQSLSVRYIGNQCSIRYQAYPRPTRLHYSSLGLGRVNWAVISTVKGPVSVIGSGVSYDMASQAIGQLTAGGVTGVPPLYARNLGFAIEQRGLWYNCTEVYGPTF
jgi:hypothetical protein